MALRMGMMVVSESQARANKKWRENHPEAHRENIRKWQKNHKEKVNEYNKNWRKKHPKEFCEMQNRSRICKILRDHKTEMSDDPERLSTDFIIDLINKGKPR
jgi:hypothetical protein